MSSVTALVVGEVVTGAVVVTSVVVAAEVVVVGAELVGGTVVTADVTGVVILSPVPIGEVVTNPLEVPTPSFVVPVGEAKIPLAIVRMSAIRTKTIKKREPLYNFIAL